MKRHRDQTGIAGRNVHVGRPLRSRQIDPVLLDGIELQVGRPHALAVHPSVKVEFARAKPIAVVNDENAFEDYLDLLVAHDQDRCNCWSLLWVASSGSPVTGRLYLR